MITTAAKDTCPLSRFVEDVLIGGVDDGRLTVNDLKAGIRHERMSEWSDWSNCELDSIELHAAQYLGESPLNAVFEQPFDRYPNDKARSVSRMSAPSPYAWT